MTLATFSLSFCARKQVATQLFVVWARAKAHPGLSPLSLVYFITGIKAIRRSVITYVFSIAIDVKWVVGNLAEALLESMRAPLISHQLLCHLRRPHKALSVETDTKLIRNQNIDRGR